MSHVSTTLPQIHQLPICFTHDFADSGYKFRIYDIIDIIIYYIWYIYIYMLLYILYNIWHTYIYIDTYFIYYIIYDNIYIYNIILYNILFHSATKMIQDVPGTAAFSKSLDNIKTWWSWHQPAWMRCSKLGPFYCGEIWRTTNLSMYRWISIYIYIQYLEKSDLMKMLSMLSWDILLGFHFRSSSPCPVDLPCAVDPPQSRHTQDILRHTNMIKIHQNSNHDF